MLTRRMFPAAASGLLLARPEGGTPALRTALFVDDHEILYRPETERVLHPLERHPGNPLLAGLAKPWEVAIAWNSVHRDRQTGRYQIWYQAFSGKLARERTHRCVVCYAESQDGLRWTRPNLGLYSYNGIADTNIVLIGNGGHSVNYGCSVLYDRRESDPSRRYKMAYFDWSKDGGREYPGLSVAFSADGKRWSKYPHGPLLRASYGNRGEAVPYRDEPGREWSVPLACSDALDVIYDPGPGVFAIYHKMWLDGPDGRMYWKHAMGRTESRDFVHWSKPELLLAPDESDPPYVEFHHSPVFFYSGCYFALLQILNRSVNGGTTDVELAVSRDGRNWLRPFRKPFFLARGAAGFDSGAVLVTPMPVLLPDEIRFYFAGYSQGVTGGDDYHLTSGIGMARMPRDRFAGLRPRQEIAQITLKPMTAAALAAATLNADASRGSIRPELLDADGRRLRGFTREDAVPLAGDSLRHSIRWKEKSAQDLAPGHYLLRLHLERAEVFALTIGADPRPRAHR